MRSNTALKHATVLLAMSSPRLLGIVISLAVIAACGSPHVLRSPRVGPMAPPQPPRAVASASSSSSAPPPTARPVLHVAAGMRHACVVDQAGVVQWWGDNVAGPLGDGTQQTQTSPRRARAPADTIAIAAGEDFTCALDRGGHVACWGGETPAHFGESRPEAQQKAMSEQACARGDKTVCKWIAANKSLRERLDRLLARTGGRRADAQQVSQHPQSQAPEPPSDTSVRALEGIAQIAAGDQEACARSKTGAVWCFAIAAPTSRVYSFVGQDPRFWKPMRVAGVDDAVQIAVGFQSSCAIRRSGQVVCWDRGDAPFEIKGVDDATQVAAGTWHACALRRSGEVACWGRGEHGQVGAVSTNTATVVRVQGLDDAAAIFAGADSTCARRASGRVVCWGQLADLGGEGAMAPKEVPAVEGAIEVAIGEQFACAALASGAVRCWGSPSRGRLGRGAMPETLAPRQVEGLRGVVDVRAFTFGTCALRSNGTVACWGAGATSAAGDKPLVEMAMFSDVVAMNARDYYACAVRRNGAASCWNAGSAPFALEGVADAIAVAPSIARVCAVRKSGEVACNYPRSPLQIVAGVRDAVDVAVGASDWACARQRSGSVACWETALSLPDAPQTTKLAPAPAFRDVVDLATSGLETCVVRKGGALDCFGSMRKPIVAVAVPEVSDAVAITMSESDMWACILRRGGTVACRGSENRWGERGDGALGIRGPLFTAVQGLTDVARVDAGYDHACAVKKDGTVVCWGNDDAGQVSGRGAKFLDPGDVVGVGR